MPTIEERVDEIFTNFDKPNSPGCALGVIKDGEFIYKRGYGMADLERDVPITPKSIFDIGSTGKQFTATIIAILANQDLLGLDDPICKYLPEMPPYADRITIRHLLHHTSGIRDYLTLMHLRGMCFENLYTEDFLLDIITRQEGLNFEPGSEYLYSNSGYFLLGTIAARVTGKHLTELLREHILTPLGMTHTTFNKDFRPIIPHRALSYDSGEAEGKFINALALSGGFGDGALITSVEDLLLWDRNFYGNKLNNSQPDLLDQLHTTGTLRDGKSIEYAFGLMISQYKGYKVVSHGGGWAGYRSEMMRFPEQHLTVICLTNLGSVYPTGLAEKVADICLEGTTRTVEISIEEPQAALQAPPAIKAEDFTGVYQNKRQTFHILVKDGTLLFSDGKTEYPLKSTGVKQFQLAEYPVFLQFAGRRNKRTTLTQYEEKKSFKRIQAGRTELASLAPYPGTYYSHELDVHYTITEKDGALQLRRTPFDTPVPLYPFTLTAFRNEHGELRLRYRKNGSVSGFLLNSGRVINIKFRKVG